MTGNKGEWSEVYVLFRLLSDGVLRPGNAQMQAIKGLVYPIISVSRGHGDAEMTFELTPESVKTISGRSCKRTILEGAANSLLKDIQSMQRTATFPQTEQLLRHLGCTQLKAASSVKADIKVLIHDIRTGLSPSLGFSIKSHLGALPTLLNASGATNFIFSLSTPIDDASRERINNIDGSSKIRKRLSALAERSIHLQYDGIQSNCFKNNLVLIDSQMPQIISELLLLYYNGYGSSLSELVQILEHRNPLNYDDSEHSFYRYKIKKLLVEIALGLLPNTLWTGKYDATGGYIVVREDGDIVCYHFYDRNIFEDYLFEQTKLDTPSTSRHSFGLITEDNKFLLNLQLRFS